MKEIRIFFQSIVAIICITACLACGGGGDGDESGASFKKSVTIPAESSSILVTLDEVREPVESFKVKDSWLTVTVTPYTTGAPTLKLSVTSNTSTDERKTIVSVVTESGAKLELTVIQKGKPNTQQEDNTIEGTHNSETDQPAYAPMR